MGDAALVAGNVAEISPEKSAEYLTSASIQWGKTSQESMKMIDSWNAISNNYATTLVKLGDGHTRVASIAKAMNVDFHELNAMIGTITATTKQSGTEIGNSLKALLPRLTQDVGKSTLAKLGVALTDESGNIRNVIDIYTDVAEKLKDMNEVEKSTAIFGLGGTYHRQRLSVLLEDLGSADSMYRKMYETSVNSTGSAMVENEKYMKSLQARINSAKIEFEKLAVSIGEAFLQDGMIEFLKVASKFLGTITEVVDTVGILPVILGTVSMAVLLLSKRAQTLTTALSAKTVQFTKATFATLKYSQSVNKGILNTQRYTQATTQAEASNRRLTMSNVALSASSARMNTQLIATRNTVAATTKATNLLSGAWGTLKSAMIWTIPFVAIGFLVERLTSASAKTRELKESAESANKELMNSFKSNQDEIDNLIGKYSELENRINKGNYDNVTLAEYYDIQNKIAQIMPSLVTGETEYGTKLVESSNVIQTKIEVLKQQLELEQQIAEWQSKQDRDARIEGNNALAEDNLKAYDEALTVIQRKLNHINYTHGTNGDRVIPIIKSSEDLISLLDEVAEMRKIAEANGDTKAIEYYDVFAEAVMESQNSLNGFDLAFKNAQSAKKVDFISKLNDTLETNASLWGNNTEGVSAFAGQLLQLSSIDSVDDINTALSSIALNGTASDEINALISDFRELNNATDENFDSILTKTQTSMTAFKNALSSSGLSDNEILAVMDSLNKKMDSTKATHSELIAEMIKSNITFEQAKMNIETYSDGTQEVGEEVDSLTSKMTDFKDVMEQMAGVSQGGIDAVNDLIFQYDMLSNQLAGYTEDELHAINTTSNLSAEQLLIKDLLSQRTDVMNQLSSIYPNLLDFDGKAISLSEQKREAIAKENKANQSLLEAYKLAREGKLSSEQSMTVTAAQGTKNRIELLKKELLALDEVFQKYKREASELNATSTGDGADKKLQSAIAERGKLTSDLNRELDELGNFSVEIDDFVTKIKESDKSSKSSNKTTKESIYFTDKYKQSLEALELAIERQIALREGEPEHANKYKNSLEAQLKLERQKLSLMEAQGNALDKQIKAGKIAQTGKVTIGDGNSKGTTTSISQGKIKGWDGNLTSLFGAQESFRKSPHTGIDVAGKKGTRFDANVNGKVIKTGNNSVSGNYVQILDEQGMKHFYGHLDKITVKLDETIEKGKQIGTIGNTGRVVAGKGGDGSHLHYEVKNSSGKNVNPMEYVQDAKSMVVTAQQVSGVVSNTTQSIDDAKSTLNGLQGDVLSQLKVIADLEKSIIESTQAGFEFKRTTYDNTIAYEEAKLQNVVEGTTRYTKTLEIQEHMLKAKQRTNREELAYTEDMIKSGNLSTITLEQMKSRTLELKTSMQSLNAEIGSLALDKLNSFYNPYQQKQDDVIDYEKNKINELDKNSSRYVKTLELINRHTNRKIITTKEHIASIEKEIKVGNLQGEVLTNAERQIKDLTLQMQSLNAEMMDTNYEIIINVKNKHDEKVDDLQFEIDRSKLLQSFNDEGSYDYIAETQKQIQLYGIMADEHDKSRRSLKAELKLYEQFPEKIKEITEMLEDETMAYWNAKKAVDELSTSVEESNKKMLESIADDAVNAYKDAIQEMEDDYLRSVDKRIKAEEELHEKKMKQLEEEMDLFRKNVQEKLDLIDKQEAERDFNMEMDELQTERSKVQDQINLLSMDNSHEAKSKRKKLQEDLDKIDKDIAEKQHDRNIDLQKENLNNLLEDKEVEIEKREELEESRHEKVITEIEREKEYWQKHYRDLLNDERKFAKLREDIIAGHLDKVQAEFNGYIKDLYATMPELKDTLDGTMKAVGTAIRQNVIDNLTLAIDKMDEFNKMKDTPSSTPISDDFNPNAPKENLNSNSSSNSPTSNASSNSSGSGQAYEKINRGDMLVMLGKYLVDEIAMDYKHGTADRDALKNAGYEYARQGRAIGSQIPELSGFNVEMGKFTDAQVKQMKSFITNYGGILGGKYKSKIDAIASLDSGGMLNFGSKSGGVDGKGGKFIIGHDEEIMLNPLETQDMLQTSTMLNRIMGKITPMISKLPSLNLPSMSSVTGDNIEVHFHVDEMIANKHQADSFAKQFAEKIRTTKGGLRR